jgi:hypothetical protein
MGFLQRTSKSSVIYWQIVVLIVAVLICLMKDEASASVLNGLSHFIELSVTGFLH